MKTLSAGRRWMLDGAILSCFGSLPKHLGMCSCTFHSLVALRGSPASTGFTRDPSASLPTIQCRVLCSQTADGGWMGRSARHSGSCTTAQRRWDSAVLLSCAQSSRAKGDGGSHTSRDGAAERPIHLCTAGFAVCNPGLAGVGRQLDGSRTQNPYVCLAKSTRVYDKSPIVPPRSVTENRVRSSWTGVITRLTRLEYEPEFSSSLALGVGACAGVCRCHRRLMGGWAARVL